MSLIVQKFGGTSVGDIERIELVAKKVAAFRAKGDDVVVVVADPVLVASCRARRLDPADQVLVDQDAERVIDRLPRDRAEL